MLRSFTVCFWEELTLTYCDTLCNLMMMVSEHGKLFEDQRHKESDNVSRAIR